MERISSRHAEGEISISSIAKAFPTPIKNETSVLQGIAELSKHCINGVDQWVLIRGSNTNNPVLLYLHGGPGAAEMFNRLSQSRLEEYYTVVNWDQRGAGKSYARNIPLATMNVEQFIADALALVEILRKKFSREKIFLMGHSWGSMLGMLLVDRHPELFAAYVGLGQLICMSKGDEISYRYTLEKAKTANNKKALAELEKIGAPPYQSGMNCISVQRKWLSRFGGNTHMKTPARTVAARILGAKVYSALDYFKFFNGILFTLKKSGLMAEIYKYDLFERIPAVKIPVYFFVGKYDYNTPWELVEQYYNTVDAPLKKLIWFDKSAHSPNIEENKKFCDELINISEERAI